MTAGIISAALGGFAAWLLARLVALLVKRDRLRNYLAVSLWSHIEESRDNQKWLTRVMADTVNVGQVVDGAPLYTRSELADLGSVRAQSVDLLTRREMVRVAKCTRALWEIEALFDGFCRRLRERQEKGIPLDHDSVMHLRARARRINALINLLPQQLKSLGDLPDDYAGKIGAEVLVPNPPVAASPPGESQAGPSGGVQGP